MFKNRKILLFNVKNYIYFLMNYSNFIVKIICQPKQSFFKNNISLVELFVQFPSVRKKNNKNTFFLSIWGNLGNDVMKYYKVNDYVLIEGFISFRKKEFETNQQIEISVSKIYPLSRNKIKVVPTLESE